MNELINTLNAELNPICHLLRLLGAHHILHVSRLRVKHKSLIKHEIFRKYSPKTLVVLEGVIPVESFPLVEWH